MEQTYRVPVREEDRVRADLALNLVAATTGVSRRRMDRTRGPGPHCDARRLAVYLAHVTFGWPFDRVGHAFGVNRTTVAKACQWAEEARDRPALDDLLDRLERCVKQAMGARVDLPA